MMHRDQRGLRWIAPELRVRSPATTSERFAEAGAHHTRWPSGERLQK